MGTGFRWTVTFQSELGNLPLLEATPVRHEVPVVETLGGVPTPLGGTFTLSFGGVSTTPLSYDVDAAVMEEALQGLSTIGSVDVSRTGPHGNGKYKWTIKFRSNLGDVQYLDFDDTQLTGSNPQVLVCGPGTQCAVGDDDARRVRRVGLDVRDLYLKDLTLEGSTYQAPEVFPNLVGYIERGEIRPVVAATYPLADIVEAQHAFLEKKFVGKIVLVHPE